MQQTDDRSVERTTLERLTAISRRNSRLVKQNAALEDTRQHLLETTALIALIAGHGDPDVAREIVSFCERVATENRAQRRFLEALRS